MREFMYLYCPVFSSLHGTYHIMHVCELVTVSHFLVYGYVGVLLAYLALNRLKVLGNNRRRRKKKKKT